MPNVFNVLQLVCNFPKTAQKVTMSLKTESLLKNITIEHIAERFVNIEIFDQSDEEMWHDQQKRQRPIRKLHQRAIPPRDLWYFRYLIKAMWRRTWPDHQKDDYPDRDKGLLAFKDQSWSLFFRTSDWPSKTMTKKTKAKTKTITNTFN